MYKGSIFSIYSPTFVICGLFDDSHFDKCEGIFGASLAAQLMKTTCNAGDPGRRPWFDSCIRKIPWRRDRLPTPVFLGFPGGSAGKESACNAEDLGSIPELGRSPGEGKGYPLQYFGLENSIDYTIVHGFAKSRT